MKRVTLCSAPTKEELEKVINEYFCSTNYFIAADNQTVINVKTGLAWGKNNGFEVRQTKRRWAFVKYVDSV